MKLSRFASYAWGVLVLNILVILWGAFVRATGSGAGCGAHWPRCNGEVIPQSPSVATMIEYTHRLTSGLALIAVVVMLVWAWRAYPRGHSVRFAAGFSMGFMIIEALIGAVLVLLRLVAHNTSIERGFSGGVHLINSFLLLGAITLTAWWASGWPAMRIRNQGAQAWLYGIAIVGVLFVGASGAIAALGDTLFPSGSLAEGLQQDFSGAAHLFVQLRIYHPVIAILVGLLSIVAGWRTAWMRPGVATRQIAIALTALFIVQFVAGGINVLLLAPVWMQIVHLLLADLVWICLVLAANIGLAAQPVPAASLATASATS